MNKNIYIKLSFLVESLKLLPLQGVWVPAGYSIKIAIPSGVPADLKSAVKKVRPIKTGDLESPNLSTAFLLAADFKSAEPK